MGFQSTNYPRLELLQQDLKAGNSTFPHITVKRDCSEKRCADLDTWYNSTQIPNKVHHKDKLPKNNRKRERGTLCMENRETETK